MVKSVCFFLLKCNKKLSQTILRFSQTILCVIGVVFLYNGYTVLDIPESMIPADQYPNLKEPRYSFPEQATKSVYEIVTTYEHIGSGNDYKIATTGLPEVQLIMDIDRPEDAAYPELWTPEVKHFE